MQNDFRNRMNLGEITEEEVKKRFLNRIKVSIFIWLQSTDRTIFFDENFIWWISEQMGESWSEEVHLRSSGYDYWTNLTLEKMSGNDFYKTIEIVEKCYQYVEEGRTREIHGYVYDDSKIVNKRKFDEIMENIMLLSEINIGIFWKNGKFYLSGAKELDEALIGDSLDWLNKHPKTKEQFSIALSHYKKSLTSVASGKDAITNCYTSIEFLAQDFLGNDKNFDKNSDLIVDKLKLPKEYKNIVYYYKQIANEYSSRHAGSDPSHLDVEAFVYLTGLLIRLVSRYS
jgi:hypothetical protein